MANRTWEGWTHGWRTWTRGQTRRDPAPMEIRLRLPTNQAERILGLFRTVWTPCVSQKHLEEPKNALKYATGRKERQTDQQVTGNGSDTKIDPKVAQKETKLCQHAKKKTFFSLVRVQSLVRVRVSLSP